MKNASADDRDARTIDRAGAKYLKTEREFSIPSSRIMQGSVDDVIQNMQFSAINSSRLDPCARVYHAYPLF